MKLKRKPYPIMKFKHSKGYVFKSPTAVYFGGALHYINKSGRIKHDSNKSVSEVKKDTMTLSEFKKTFYDPEKF